MQLGIGIIIGLLIALVLLAIEHRLVEKQTTITNKIRPLLVKINTDSAHIIEEEPSDQDILDKLNKE